VCRAANNRRRRLSKSDSNGLKNGPFRIARDIGGGRTNVSESRKPNLRAERGLDFTVRETPMTWGQFHIVLWSYRPYLRLRLITDI